MAPGVEIKMHVDAGKYATNAHRIHVPLSTDLRVLFDVCPGDMVPMAATTPNFTQDVLEHLACLTLPIQVCFEHNIQLPPHAVQSL